MIVVFGLANKGRIYAVLFLIFLYIVSSAGYLSALFYDFIISYAKKMLKNIGI